MTTGIQEISKVIEKVVERTEHGRTALLYSGGIESSLLLHLMEPWRSKTTVYIVRTGAEFPHMVEFQDRKLRDWDHHIIKADLGASFRELGIPASVVPVEHMQGVSEQMNIIERAPRIVPWMFCCVRNRCVPGYEAIAEDGIVNVIHGQRAGDWPKNDPSPTNWQSRELLAKGTPMHFHHPLWDMSRVQVQEAVTELGIELPEHYSEYPSSLDCALCPSSLTTKRRAWMSQRYPKELEVAEGLHALVKEAVVAALDGDNTKNAYTVR
jgi:3'-phosphoadenosine 5'-phosphosulfate sulfotransferase (PAPS reductase)/FAD synthetase